MSGRGELVEAAASWVLALGVAVWAWARGADGPTALPGPPVVGARLDEVVERREGPDLSVPEPGAVVDMGRLAFDDYDPPELRADAGALGVADFPPAARALDGRDVVLEGFPLVVDLDEGEVRELLLTRFPPGCCFGAVPVLDEWVLVELEQPLPADEVPPQAALRGVLEVGEILDERGAAQSLYRMRAGRVVER